MNMQKGQRLLFVYYANGFDLQISTFLSYITHTICRVTFKIRDIFWQKSKLHIETRFFKIELTREFKSSL